MTETAVALNYTLQDLTRLIAKRHFCVLATQGLHVPHVAGVGYFARGLDIYIRPAARAPKLETCAAIHELQYKFLFLGP